VAGNGTHAWSGDGGPAASASLNNPYGIAADGAGNLFIADTLNSRIRRVDANTGIITTVAGTGTFASSGDAGPATAASIGSPYGVALDGSGHIFIADQAHYLVRRIGGANSVITA